VRADGSAVQNFNVRVAAAAANLRAAGTGSCCSRCNGLCSASATRLASCVSYAAIFYVNAVSLFVVFGIRQYILVFSLISSNFISVLSILDCRYLESGSSLSLAPLRKSAIFITFGFLPVSRSNSLYIKDAIRYAFVFGC